MNILVFNAGSSSLRFQLFEARGKKLSSLFEGRFDSHDEPIRSFERTVKQAIELLHAKGFLRNAGEVTAIGHRVVHGGELYSKPTRITKRVLAEIGKLSKLAPLHNPSNLACILACQKLFPNVPQVAVFDTAFHQSMPEHAYLYGLPYSLAKKLHIRRYGFHGTSHQYVFEQARKKLGSAKTRRTITCHLGNGCSMAAILNGRVVDTSMGFTPLEGLPMGTRSGDLDPAIIFYLADQGMSLKKIRELLHHESGLLGVSELSSDVRDLWAAYQKKSASAKRTKASRALHWMAYRIAKYIGSYATALGGLDCLVFTGGMGEHAFYLRKWVLEYVKWMPQKKVLVIPTDEERKIAEEVLRNIPVNAA